MTTEASSVLADKAAEIVAEWIIEHYGEQYLEDHGPDLVLHEPSRPGVSNNLPGVSNFPIKAITPCMIHHFVQMLHTWVGIEFGDQVHHADFV